MSPDSNHRKGIAMNLIVLNNKTSSGESLQATFLPDLGMNMISFRKGDIEVIDQSTKGQFEERFAGLGPMIGPHFHRRHAAILPKIPDESIFPHIARVKAKGIADPFSHGIGRYAPWRTIATPTGIKATLSGKDTWNGVPLATLEGQNFTMHYDIELSTEGLQISLDVVSDTDSIVGIHYYYHLPNGTGTVSSGVQPQYLDHEGLKRLPADWPIDSQHVLSFDLANEADYTFYPYPNPREGSITLDAGVYSLITTYQSPSQESAWQLYHPKGASFVCIEPVSAQDPRHPNLSVSSLKIRIRIE